MARLRNAPFTAYKWEVAIGSNANRHPAAGTPHYSVVDASHIIYNAPMICAYGSSPCDADLAFFLNTDMWDL